MSHDNDLGAFLRSRRAKVAPETVGLPAGSRRRVAGLRREEVALLAGISVEYYQRLEQGRANRPSDEVLDSVARILGLGDVELAHLHRLASAVRRSGPPEPERPARPELVRMLGLMDRIPALIINHRSDVLALNPLAEAMFPGVAALSPTERNLARFLFLDPGGRDFYVEWDDVAAATAAQLRLASGARPGDGELTRLVGELAAGSPAFRHLWDQGDVEDRTHGVKNLRHPELGVLTVEYQNFVVAGEDSQRMVAFDADPDGPTAAAFGLLAARRQRGRSAERTADQPPHDLITRW